MVGCDSWASEMSPTLGCSIEISNLYIYICRYVGLSTGNQYKNTYDKMRGRDYMAQTRAYSKSVLGG